MSHLFVWDFFFATFVILSASVDINIIHYNMKCCGVRWVRSYVLYMRLSEYTTLKNFLYVTELLLVLQICQKSHVNSSFYSTTRAQWFSFLFWLFPTTLAAYLLLRLADFHIYNLFIMFSLGKHHRVTRAQLLRTPYRWECSSLSKRGATQGLHIWCTCRVRSKISKINILSVYIRDRVE